MMFARHRTKYWITAAVLASVVLAATFLFLPGFRNYDPPPETIGADLVVSGPDFSSGEHDATVLVDTDISGQALALDNASARGAFIAEPVQADYSFSALGLHWLADMPQGTDVSAEVRFSTDGSQWGDWQNVIIDVQEAPEHINQTKSAGETIGQLVFADGEARYFQYRMNLAANASGDSPTITRLTASYIDARGYHESPVSVGRLWGRVSAALEPEPASAQPGIISRAQWGANEAYMQWDPTYVAPKKIIVHHTVTSNNDPDPFATVRSIYYYHAVSLGWGDIGYNFLIDRLGRIYEGRYGGNGVVGGHALTWNPGSIGVSAMGNYEEVGPSAEMVESFVSLMTWKSNVNQIDPYGTDYMNGTYSNNYLGHRDVYSTACPGQFLYPYLPYFRSAARNGYSPIPIVGGIRVKWESLYRAPGSAINTEYRVPASGDPWLGQAQDFYNGRIFWNPEGGTFWIHGGILAKYDQLGRETGTMGIPKSDEYGISNGSGQDFANGRIYWSPTTSTHAIQGAILDKFLNDGGIAIDGFPTSDEYDISGHPGGRTTDFAKARIYWTPSGSSRTVRGAILNKYLALGGPGSFLDLPTSDETDITGLAGGRQSNFTGGIIYWAPGVGASSVPTGAIMTKYLAQGGPAGAYGVPAGDQFTAGSGRAQNMQRAMLTWDGSANPAYAVYGGIMGKYKILGGPTGPYGFAQSDERDVTGVTGGRESVFTGGRIYWGANIGTFGLQGAIFDKFLELGGPATNGMPVTNAYPAWSGWAQNTERSIMTWDSSLGAHLVYGGIMGKYAMMGGPAGALHLATSDEMDVPGVSGARENDFQNGRIYWSAVTGGHVVNGGIYVAYMGYGGPTSALGLPVSDEYNYGSGRRSDFQGGYIYWSAQTGTQVFARAAVTVTADSTFEARDGNGTLLATVAAGQTASVWYSDGVYGLQAPGFYSTGSSLIRFAASGGVMQVTSYHDHPAWNPSLDDNRFRGTIEVRYSPVSNKVWVVNELPLELYLRGIAETSSGSPPEYLKTMTVAARDYALWHVNNGGKDYGSGKDIFHLKNSRNGNGDDQQFRGYGLEIRFTDLVTAITATAGQVVTYNGSLALATYFSNSDGRTRSAQEAWGTTSWPWLASVSDPDCNGMTMNGHGVGISGTGALARANRGNTYQQILTYYYTGTVVQAMDTNKNIRVAIAPVS